jgi:hypothetical protein
MHSSEKNQEENDMAISQRIAIGKIGGDGKTKVEQHQVVGGKAKVAGRDLNDINVTVAMVLEGIQKAIAADSGIPQQEKKTLSRILTKLYCNPYVVGIGSNVIADFVRKAMGS